MKIIPAIDILNGKCVRLTKGDYTTQIVYNEDPLEVALAFESYGIVNLHVVDLDGAKSKHVVNHKILERLATKTKLKIDFGGGIKSDADLKVAFDCGAAQITAGSVAVDEPDVVSNWLLTYGPQRIILGADCHNRKVATHGWKQSSDLDVFEFIAGYIIQGITDVICTDIEKDGMLEGPSIALYREIIAGAKLNLIASGGIASIKDVLELKAAGCAGAIIGKAIYENKITLKELSRLC